MSLLSINGVVVATPSKFKCDIADIDGDTTRNARGEMVRNRVAVKRKLSLEWPPLTDAEISRLLQAVQAVFFTVTYPDPMTGAQATRTFYVGDRSAPAYSWASGLPKWEGLTMNFIEK